MSKATAANGHQRGPLRLLRPRRYRRAPANGQRRVRPVVPDLVYDSTTELLHIGTGAVHHVVSALIYDIDGGPSRTARLNSDCKNGPDLPDDHDKRPDFARRQGIRRPRPVVIFPSSFN